MNIAQASPIYELTVTAIGPLVAEFTEAGIWVLFHESVPEELAEFAILHRAAPPRAPLAPGHTLQIEQDQYRITAVGAVANHNLRELGHLVLKANGATEAELPGDVCVEARPLPQPRIGMRLWVWANGEEVGDGAVRAVDRA
ncbi:PTS glucitol/sorbitol transporter subunit IIA [Kallotenue papyrolyticum]|uniref:PTS glucitol/sorbitol transporter subunit IIA n=1 Tax=Kallotenue papyrolyticum TaxID=1325125 RepID=UPI0004927623|nr:PTS glucitol/sorbitol transporter subunit IIA [Kallotenue papyrolyticum]